MERFYLLMVDGSSPATYRYYTYVEARSAAEELAAKTDKHVYILESTARCKAVAVKWEEAYDPPPF
jgi:hypothetical protein